MVDLLRNTYSHAAQILFATMAISKLHTNFKSECASWDFKLEWVVHWQTSEFMFGMVATIWSENVGSFVVDCSMRTLHNENIAKSTSICLSFYYFYRLLWTVRFRCAAFASSRVLFNKIQHNQISNSSFCSRCPRNTFPPISYHRRLQLIILFAHINKINNTSHVFAVLFSACSRF
jgi:hypothetical protein